MNFLAIYAWGILITFALQILYEVMRTREPDGDQRYHGAAVTIAALLWPLFWLVFLILGIVLCWARVTLFFTRRILRKYGGR